MVTTTNREVSDEMLYEAKSIFREEMQYFLEIITSNPSIVTMDLLDFIIRSYHTGKCIRRFGGIYAIVAQEVR